MTTAIPPATTYKRQITPTIRTAHNTGNGWVKAEYVEKRTYDTPFGPPAFAQVSAERATGKWIATITVQGFAQDDEVTALQDLFANMHVLELAVPDDAVLVARALASAIADGRPWEEHPLGLRTYKPRRKRHTWLDKTTGKRVNLYPETLKRHADPACQCQWCTKPR